MALCGSRSALLSFAATCSRRYLHHSPALSAKKTLLMKFASKTKKKFWYAGPTVGSQLMYKPPSFLNSLTTSQLKTRKEDSIRMRALNVILYKAVTELLDTCEVSQETYDLRLEVSKVSLASDFSACRVYWKTNGEKETDDNTEKILLRSAPRIRHLLLTHQVMGRVPPIVFVKDRENAAILEIEKLLAVADFGPEALDDVMPSQSDLSAPAACSDLPPSSNLPNLFGIDHEELNTQITEYKKRSKQKENEAASADFAEQLAELRKQKILRRKMKERKRFNYDDDITPQKYLLDKYCEDDLDSVSSEEHELPEDLEELEAEDLNTPTETQESKDTKS